LSCVNVIFAKYHQYPGAEIDTYRFPENKNIGRDLRRKKVLAV
jgi:hypothetical protein